MLNDSSKREMGKKVSQKDVGWKLGGGDEMEQRKTGEVKERAAGTRQEENGGHSFESGPLCKWRCTKPLLTWISQD